MKLEQFKPSDSPHLLPDNATALIVVPAGVVEGMSIDTHLRFALQYTRFIMPRVPAVESNNSVDILLEKENGSYQTVALPSDMQARLFDYLSSPPEGKFDCGCFIQQMYGQQITPETFDFSQFKKEEYLHPAAVAIGDSLVMYDNRTKAPVHFALSLGNNLYLFKIGWRASQQLTVATFESMREIYGTAHAKVLSPVVP